MEVQIISEDSIKPSSPTPTHLRTHKLSLLDQLIPAPYAPIILFYPNFNGASLPERLLLLKQSLSETLTLFYPLAGIIRDDLSIDCNDEGAYFVHASVSCRLLRFLEKPDVMAVSRFLPREPAFRGSTAGTRVANVQVNVFECGGIAIGLCVSHKILDGAALATFLKAWSAAARGTPAQEVIVTNSMFPANDLWLRDSSMAMWGSLFKKGTCITKRFVFNSSAINKLKANAAISSNARYPTRVEAVSAFLWKSFMEASKQKHGYQRDSLVSHVVNLRKRMGPVPSSQNTLHNLIWITNAKAKPKTGSKLGSFVDNLRESILKIDGDFVKKMRGEGGRGLMSKSLKEMGEFGSKDGVDYFGFTSWCKLGFYEADFGWGKPIWVSGVGSGGSVFLNLVVLMETGCGDGMEAWVTLDEEEMRILEGNEELMALAILDPSPAGVTEGLVI